MRGRTRHRCRTGSPARREPRYVDGVERPTVQVTAVQFADGRIDDGGVHEPPHVYLGDDALTSAQARELAALLVGAADEAGRWAASSDRA
jgi:hypothetical protein